MKAYGSAAQLHATFEMYRAFPVNVQFNAAQNMRIDVPLFVGAGEQSPFSKLLPRISEGLRASRCTRVETGQIHDAGHYVVSDQRQAVAGLIEHYASLESRENAQLSAADH